MNNDTRPVSLNEHYIQGYTTNQQTPDFDEDKKKYYSVNVFGSTASIQFKPDVTKNGTFTVKLESATKINDQGKAYDWKNLIALQITNTDILKFLMVSLGLISSADFMHYGANNDKNATFKYQFNAKYGPQVFAQINQKNKKQCSIPIPMSDMIQAGHLALCQYIKNHPSLTTDAAMMSLSRLAQLTKNNLK
jgi:hypothetical protein